MNRHLLASILLLASAQAALAQKCIRIACDQGDYCEVAPSRLTAALPPGFEIRSIRGNTKIASQGEAALLECRPASRLPVMVSADKASIYGSVHVTGKLHASGTLRFEPNDGGELEFRPDRETLQVAGRFFKTNFMRIKLDEAQPSVKVAPPKSFASADCWQANATAELSDFSVLIGDTSAAGTYARQARVTQVNGFTKCTWGGK
ncbi:MAG: hypothetical protein EOO80_05485 [Oxalobacteraceae bacterium]|nr:MAG: hypothetical protein EOO80_05485 [Oxalobacteraceae bacterium]